MVKRKRYSYKNGIVDIEEYHDGRYGRSGTKREKKEKPTNEQMRLVNIRNKEKLCRQRMLEYIKPGDILATWTYDVRNRPPDMEGAKEDFRRTMRAVRKEYRKRGHEVFWFRNIQKGTKGAWHIHLVINEIGDTVSILTKAWTKGGTWSIEIKNSQYYDEDFTKLANYITRDESVVEKKKDGSLAKPRISESSYNISRNMPVPEPKVDKLIFWKAEPKIPKGYYIYRIYEGINPVTGYKYRKYTLLRLGRGEVKPDETGQYVPPDFSEWTG